MNETMVILSATGAASFMVTLARDGISPDLRTAVRTTLVVILGWAFACFRYGLKKWPDLVQPVRWILALSALAVVFAWLLYFHARRKRTISGAAMMDHVNVGFAVLFTVLFSSQQASTQSALIGFVLVGGVLVLAFGSR
jgi:bacterial/archaeal transporter family protein